MRNRFDGVDVAFSFLGCGLIVFEVALSIAAICVVWHFVAKFW